MDGKELDRIKRRHLARFLAHLEERGSLTRRLERDIRRNYSWVFQDIHKLNDRIDRTGTAGEEVGHGE